MEIAFVQSFPGKKEGVRFVAFNGIEGSVLRVLMCLRWCKERGRREEEVERVRRTP